MSSYPKTTSLLFDLSASLLETFSSLPAFTSAARVVAGINNASNRDTKNKCFIVDSFGGQYETANLVKNSLIKKSLRTINRSPQ